MSSYQLYQLVQNSSPEHMSTDFMILIIGLFFILIGILFILMAVRKDK